MALSDFIIRSVDENVIRTEIITYKSKFDDWVTIRNKSHAHAILHELGDEDKSKILTSTMEESLTISEILSKCKIPQTSCYRKINELINRGLLIPTESIKINDRIKTTKYVSVLQNVKINIIENKITIKIKFRPDLLQIKPKFFELQA